MRLVTALRRARLGILTIALTFSVSVAAGMIMAHAKNSFALRSRDQIVDTAYRESTILRQYKQKNYLTAAALDAAANAGAALLSIPAGYGIVSGYGLALYRGWIGGIVSVDSKHRSRLAGGREAFYYLVTLLLQLLPYSMAGGAGVNLGLAALGTSYPGPRIAWLKIPHAALADAAWIYLLTLPLFAVASVFEFTM